MADPRSAPRAAPNAAVAELRRIGLTPAAFSRAAQTSEGFARRVFAGAKLPGKPLQQRIELLWPSVEEPMWSRPADGRSKAARMLEGPRTPPGPLESVVDQLLAGKLTGAAALAAWSVELRRHSDTIEAATRALTDRDRVLGHAGYRSIRSLVLELFAIDPRLVGEASAALPALEAGGPIDQLRAARGELEPLRVWLQGQADEAHAQTNLVYLNRVDTARRKAEQLIERSKVTAKSADLLKTDTWLECVIGMCGVLRGESEALEDLVSELQPEIDAHNPFAVALSRALLDVRHITWPCERFQDDVVGFFETILGVELYDKQLEILADAGPDCWVAVRSGHRIGKSLLLAGLALWFYSSFPRARVFIIAPTDHQLQSIDWREIRMRVLEAGVCIGCKAANEGRAEADKVRAPCPHSARIEGVMRETAKAGMHSGDLREITGLSARQPEAAAGLAGVNLCFLVEEASGVASPIMTAIKGNLAGGGMLWLFGNPTQQEGDFYDAFHQRKDPDGPTRELYKCHTISSWDSPNARGGLQKGDRGYIPGLATRAWCEDRKREWGADSEDYSVRVLGVHYAGGTSRLITVQTLIEAEERFATGSPDDESGPLIIGVDPCGAEGSGDDGGFAPRRGNRILEVVPRPGPLTPKQHLSEVLALHARWSRSPRELMVVVIDVEGVGVGVASEFDTWSAANPSRMRVVRVRASSRAQYEPTIYHLQRDALAGHFAAWLKQGGAIPADLRFNAELRALAMKLKMTPRGERLKLKPKDQMKVELHRSPDLYDAAALAAWGDSFGQWEPVDEDGEPAAEDASGRNAAGGIDPYAGGVDPYA